MVVIDIAVVAALAIGGISVAVIVWTFGRLRAEGWAQRKTDSTHHSSLVDTSRITDTRTS